MMKISTILKLTQIVLITGAFVFATSAIAPDAAAQGKSKGKPSFAGKPDEKLGKGGRSEAAKEHAKSRGNKGNKVKKAKKAKRGKKR
jgi:hypothetical protein